MMNRSESVDNTCPVCHDVTEIYAIGPCDHPVCYRCSTRMRVLCETADCPICRSLMPQVAFVHKRATFKEINLRDCIPNRKNKIFYEDEGIEGKYLNLLEFKCRLCPNRKPDRTFVLLQTHMRREHQLFACDLCLSHLKIFPYERKFYDRKHLATHRRVGDPDDKSYKGHPLCEFCDVRYNDNDDLMKHLRKDHYYCHFCDQQGSNAYYNEYPDLKQHFADSHYLCTEDICGDPNTQFTHAFSSEIDLKAHKAKMHNRNMSKMQSREARNIEVDFQYHSRRQSYNRGVTNTDGYEDSGSHRNRGGERYNHRRQQKEDPQLLRALAESMEMAAAAQKPPPIQERLPDPVHDFPSLNGAPVVPVLSSPVKQKQSPEEDFPSLSVAKSQGITSQTQSQSKAYASVMNHQAEPKSVPKEKGESKPSKPVVLGSVSSKSKDRWTSQAPVVTEENFPSLTGRDFVSNDNVSNINLSCDWSKTSKNEVENNVNVIPSKSFVEETFKKVKHKSSKQLEKSIGDENEFPILESSGRENNVPVLNNSLWPKPKSNKKTDLQPRKEKIDDNSFELPESYYKTYEKNGMPRNEMNENANDGGVKSEMSKSGSNKNKDFPSLPVREPKLNSNTDQKKKLKPKEKKSELPKSEKPSSSKPKKPRDGPSSLSDIAQGLVIDRDQSNNKSSKGRSRVNQAPKLSKTDWFDNPPVEVKEHVLVTQKKDGTSIEDKTTELPSTVDNSFPSLHSMSTPIQNSGVPPGFSSNPPKLSISSVIPAPPGFSQSVAAPPGFSVITTTPATYIQPAEFSARNQQLIQKIFGCLHTVENGFQNFKALSGQYRQGVLEANEYYIKCQRLMGEEDFSKVFSELIALLPDIPKQKALWAVHQTAISNKPEQQAGKSTQSKALWKQMSAMTPCSKCGQIVSCQDEQHHNLQHGEQNDFPTLKNGTDKGKEERGMKEPNNPVKGAWIKAK